jgi:hypothetical protein
MAAIAAIEAQSLNVIETVHRTASIIQHSNEATHYFSVVCIKFMEFKLKFFTLRVLKVLFI